LCNTRKCTMGDSIEEWRAIIVQWIGGRPGKCETLQHCTAQTSNHIGYSPIRFVLLVSLIVISCVELNPGPDHDTSATSESGDDSAKFIRRSGTGGQHGKLYEIKMAAFLFARPSTRQKNFTWLQM